MGIPHDEDKVGTGRGNRLLYRYEDIVELGVALYALHRGMKPMDIAIAIKQDRETYLQVFRDALARLSEAELNADWVKSRGRTIPVFLSDIHLRLHARYSKTPGRYEIVAPDQATSIEQMFGLREIHGDGEGIFLVPLTRLAIEYLAWAREAPEIRPGRTARS
jgi:hypothetical protein